MSDSPFLIIGASGLVGRCLMGSLFNRGVLGLGTYATRPSPGLRPLDITDASQVGACIAELRPRTIYLTGALTHVDYCEDHKDEAWRINVQGPRAVAEEARRAGAKLVFYSTEYIFDGAAGPYAEDAAPNPLSAYGRTKLEAENIIRGILEDALILRTTVVFGWDRQSKNFAMQIHERVQSGSEMKIPEDQVGSPTWATYLADSSVKLVQKGARGIVNVVGKDNLPRTEFARALVRVFGGNSNLVVPVATASLRQKAARPLRGGLRPDKLRDLLGEEPMSLEDSLERLKRDWQQSL
jgi:dTDP-4-dehydrorhamnose reductase